MGWQDVGMLQRPRRRRPTATRSTLFASIAVAALVTACGSDGPNSQTPQLELDEESAMIASLLQPDDVSAIAGFDGVEAKDLRDVPVFENPDPRGPCGSPVPPPAFADGTGRALTGGSLGLIQLVTPATDAQTAYFEAILADDGPPCESYTSTTNTGATQNVSEITVYGVSGDGVRGVAWTNLVEVDGGSVYTGVVAAEAADAISFVQVQSASPIPQEGMQLLAEATVLRMQQGG